MDLRDGVNTLYVTYQCMYVQGVPSFWTAEAIPRSNVRRSQMEMALAELATPLRGWIITWINFFRIGLDIDKTIAQIYKDVFDFGIFKQLRSVRYNPWTRRFQQPWRSMTIECQRYTRKNRMMDYLQDLFNVVCPCFFFRHAFDGGPRVPVMYWLTGQRLNQRLTTWPSLRNQTCLVFEYRYLRNLLGVGQEFKECRLWNIEVNLAWNICKAMTI